MCQPLELALHDAHLVLQHPPPLNDVCRARVQDLFIQELFLLLFLLGIFHFGILVAAGLLAIAIALVLLLVSGFALKVVEVLKGRHGEK